MKLNPLYSSAVALAFGLVLHANATTVYVDFDAPLNGTGQSWNSPYRYLQDALLQGGFQFGDEIHVGGGSYRPDKSEHHSEIVQNDRAATFVLIQGVILRGGYAGYGATNGEAAGGTSFLTGAIGTSALEDNSYHVVTAVDISGTNPAILERLTIREGYAVDLEGLVDDDDAACYDDPDTPEFDPLPPTKAGGAGMECVGASPTIRNVIFEYNHSTAGGGLRLLCNSNPLISLCTFRFNEAVAGTANDPPIPNWPGSGGGIYMYGQCSPKIFSTTFKQNHADHIGGGVALQLGGSPELTQCIFNTNSAGTSEAAGYGGGMRVGFDCTAKV